MGTEHFMSKGHKGRNTNPSKARANAKTTKPAEPTDQETADRIENERGRLSEAETILQCVHIAMESADGESDDMPYYPTLIDMAKRRIRTAVRRLDAIYLNLDPRFPRRVAAADEGDGGS